MRMNELVFLLVPLLAVSAVLPAMAANKAVAPAKAGYKEIPAFNWNLAAKGFSFAFPDRETEISASEPNRFFPGTVAFVLVEIDANGHFLKLNCGSTDTCNTKRDSLEDRMIYSTLLEVLKTPKITKEQLYNQRSWELTPLGEKYMAILHKRYPDLSARLGRLVGSAFASRK